MSQPGFEVLYEEGPCLVVCKPPGLLTQAPPGIDSLEARIKDFYRQREGKTGNIYLGVPHRLDRPASGVMVFARHSRAARRLAEQFEGRLVRKLYWACVAGQLDAPEGTWTDQMRKIPDQAQAEIVPDNHPEGRLAVLHYRQLGQGPWGTWLEIELETGRMHQIRIQAASRGHPLLGDARYGSTVPFGPQYDDVRQRAIALHARTLSFRHPMTREPVTVTAAPPEAWQGLGIGD
jgi:RluA family pseudouridine synthase